MEPETVDRVPCPHCRRPMMRSLDGSGRWTCLPCNKRWEHSDLVNAQAANAGMSGIQDEINKLSDLFQGKGR